MIKSANGRSQVDSLSHIIYKFNYFIRNSLKILFMDFLIFTYLPRLSFWHWGGLNSVMGYARLRPRAYNLALRLRPGTKKRIEGAK